MKLNRINIISLILIIFLLIINISLIIQNQSIKKSILNEINTNKETVMEIDKKNELLFDDIHNTLTENREYQENEFQVIQEALSLLLDKSDVQFSKTVKMKQTYDEILAEQKKKTVDISSKDNSVIQTKKMADEYYSNKEYLKAYELYKKVLVYWNEDLEVRMSKLKSLFYSNRADNSNYSEIIEDIRIIKNNQSLDEECSEIEKIILMEKEGLHE